MVCMCTHTHTCTHNTHNTYLYFIMLYYKYVPTFGKLQLCVPTAGNGQQSTSTKAEQQSSVPLPNASGDATKVKIDEQSSVPYMRTASGARYALSEKSSIIKDNSRDRQVCTNAFNM